MPTDLEGPITTGSPVLKRGRIGEHAIGGLVNFASRNILNDNGEPVLKDNGKPRQEMVVHLLFNSGDMVAGIKGESAVPEQYEEVRLILKGGAFAQWIEAGNIFKAENGRGRRTGDLVYVDTTHAERYFGTPPNMENRGSINTAEEQDTYMADPATRQETLGFRGELKIKEPVGDDYVELVELCDRAYMTSHVATTELETAPAAAPAGAPASAADMFK